MGSIEPVWRVSRSYSLSRIDRLALGALLGFVNSFGRQLACGLLLAGAAFGAGVGIWRTRVEKLVAEIVFAHGSDDLSEPVRPSLAPVHERLIAMAQRERIRREDIQAVLMDIVEAGYSAPDDDGIGYVARVDGIDALSALAGVADGTALDRLVAIADTRPPRMHHLAIVAAICIAARTAHARLPAVAHKLGRRDEDAIWVLFGLRRALSDFTPKEPTDRAHYLAAIRPVLEEAAENPDAEQGFVDSLLVEFYPEYRSSSVRRHRLDALARSQYPEVKREAIEAIEALERGAKETN